MHCLYIRKVKSTPAQCNFLITTWEERGTRQCFPGLCQRSSSQEVQKIISTAQAADLPIERVSKHNLNVLTNNSAHQVWSLSTITYFDSHLQTTLLKAVNLTKLSTGDSIGVLLARV